MASLFNIGVSGLRAQQTALAVTGQNITNASTPGYARQRVEISPQSGGTAGGIFHGSGATLERITRIADEFAARQIRSDNALFSEFSTLANQISQIEGVLFDDEGGVDAALSALFAAFQDANASPTSIPSRRIVLDQADALSTRMNAVADRLDLQTRNVQDLLGAAAARVNELAQGIADLNDRITGVRADAESGAANPLLDQREELLKELSQFVQVTTAAQSNGQVNVFIGKGQALVLGTKASVLGVDAQGAVTFAPDSRTPARTITAALSGGEIGGLLRFQAEVLDPALNQLGRLAMALSSTFNSAHAEGVDLNGRFGGDLFRDINDPALVRLRTRADENNDLSASAQINVYVDDPLQAPVSDYHLVFEGEGLPTFFVQRQSDGEIVYQGVVDGSVPQTFSFDGIRVEFAGGELRGGNGYQLEPFKGFGSQIATVLTDPASLALSAPVSLAQEIGNQGSGRVTSDRVFDPSHPIFSDSALVPPLLVRFIDDTHFDVLDNSDPARPVDLDPPLRGIEYVPGQANTVLPDQANTTVVTSSGTGVGALPSAPLLSTGASPVGSGYPAGAFRFDVLDPSSGQITQSRTVSVAANQSARQIAQALGGVPGVQASARTTLTLSSLSNNAAGTPMTLTLNGVLLQNFASLSELADAINDSPALQEMGVVAMSDGTSLEVTALHGDNLDLYVTGDPADSITLTDRQGSSMLLNGAGSGSGRNASVGGSIDLRLEPGLRVSTQINGLFAGNPEHQRADLGFTALISGQPAAGDRFRIGYNNLGVGDNANGLRIAALAEQTMIGSPGITYAQAYAELVQNVGVEAGKAQVNRDSADALLTQSVAAREAISGVNLDEEAANLIRFEQAYNASAQVISVARDIFNTLFNAVA